VARSPDIPELAAWGETQEVALKRRCARRSART
jgi:hypothetical protein